MENLKGKLTLPIRTKAIDNGLFNRIGELNLDLIINRLMFKHDWSKERVDAAINEYKHYLLFTQLFETPISPGIDCDFLWHEHILHTNKYALDCQFLFGKFLHHLPNPSQPKIFVEAGSCSSPCCNKQDCCNDNPAKSIKFSSSATCGEPVPDGCVNIGGSDENCGGTTSDEFKKTINFDNPDMTALVKSIPYELAYVHFLAGGYNPI